MLDFPALPINKTLSTSSRANEHDVVVTKLSLSRLGHFDMDKHGLTPFPDAALFESIKSFQKAHGLNVDGAMRPGGETARQIGQLMSSQSFELIGHRQKSDEEQRLEQCDYLYIK